MNKGTVMSIDQKWATVFTEDCQMIKLPLQPDMAVGKEIQINMERTEARNVTIARRFRPALVAACFVLLLTVGLLFSQGLIFNPVYATVSIDVNPSLELTLNRQLKVLSVKAMNQEAERLMVGEDYKGLGLEESIYRWTRKLQSSNQYQVKTMLLSAVLPDEAVALKTQLMQIEENQNQGELKNIAVRFIYTNDEAVAKQARKNGLSVGRQMLLNQAQIQNQNYNRENIASAPLDQLIPNLLKNQDRDQTRLTERTTQSLSEPSGSGSASTNRETSRETSRETARDTSGASSGTGSGSAATNQNTNQYTKGSTQGTGSGTTATSQYTNQQTNQYSSQQTSQSTNGSTQSAGTGTTATNQETHQSTNGTTADGGSGTTASSQAGGSTSGSGTGTGGTGTRQG